MKVRFNHLMPMLPIGSMQCDAQNAELCLLATANYSCSLILVFWHYTGYLNLAPKVSRWKPKLLWQSTCLSYKTITF